MFERNTIVNWPSVLVFDGRELAPDHLNQVSHRFLSQDNQFHDIGAVELRVELDQLLPDVNIVFERTLFECYQVSCSLECRGGRYASVPVPNFLNGCEGSARCLRS